MPKYVVTAPYVTLTTNTAEGKRLMGFFQGAPVPPDVPEDQIKYHLRDKMIAEVEDPAQVGAVGVSPQEAQDLAVAGESPLAVAHQRVVDGEKQRGNARAAQRKAAETQPAKDAGPANAAKPKQEG